MKPSNLVLFFLFVIVTFSANAQKLPNVQTTSLRAPADIKVDGKSVEWKKFQAYNKATDLYYSLANDKDKLYLVIQATDEGIIKKIVMGGVSLTISSTNKRNTKDAATITFPVFDANYPPSYFTFNKSNLTTPTNVDSLMQLHNKALSTKYKLIGVSGIKNIKDSLLSIYNNEEIKVAAMFDKQLNYTYEIAVPLKYLNLNNNQTFTYNIKINPATISGRKLELIPGRNIVTFTGANGVNYVLDNNPQNFMLVSPTDFWGEYNLAK